MKRITVPEPQIDLYNDGFEGHDLLERAETGQKLSDLVERIDEPLVIALDGAWGSGKSHFLKCWVGEHLKRANNTTQTVYLDAFKHDYLDDPLIALTGEIARRFEAPPPAEANEVETVPVKSRALAKLCQFGAFAGRNSGKIAVSFLAKQAQKALGEEDFDQLNAEFKEVLSDGISSIEDDAKALFDAETDEAGTEDFWKAQRAKIASMEGFRLALTELTEPATEEQAEQDDDLDEGDPTRKLVIVIDELDRCRPDYALQLLEIIKHFFNVPGVHFVLGVNLAELQNSVRARYGSGVDASTYLQKFISLHFYLPSLGDPRTDVAVWKMYFDQRCKDSAASDVWGDRLVQVVALLECIKETGIDAGPREISLRDIDRLVPVLSLVSENVSNLPHGESLVLSALAITKALSPNTYPHLRARSAERYYFDDLFNLGRIENMRMKEFFSGVFSYAFNGSRQNGRENQFANAFGSFGLDDHERKVLFESLAEKYLETFTLARP